MKKFKTKLNGGGGGGGKRFIVLFAIRKMRPSNPKTKIILKDLGT